MFLKEPMNITHSGSLSSTIDLFAKLQRDAAALEKHDDFFNFVVTGSANAPGKSPKG
jgi:hypothetical protein